MGRSHNEVEGVAGRLGLDLIDGGLVAVRREKKSIGWGPD